MTDTAILLATLFGLGLIEQGAVDAAIDGEFILQMRAIYGQTVWLPLFFLLPSCAPLTCALLDCSEPNRNLQSYVERFVAEGRNRGRPVNYRPLTLAFTDDMPNLAESQVGAVCHPDEDPRRIEVDNAVWGDRFFSEDTRRELMFHELGHCLLNLPHQEAPLGIMNSRLPTRYQFAPHEAQFLDALFVAGDTVEARAHDAAQE